MTDTTYDHGMFSSSVDDTDIFYQSWTVPDAKALLVVSHGLGEHGGRYGHVVDAVAPAGFAVYALDHRGHGRSGGKRGHLLAFSEYVEDLRAFVELAKSKHPAPKTFLLGHSMGGLIALTYALQYPGTIDGLVASAPALKLAVEVPKIKEILGRKLSELWPSLSMSNELDPNFISRDSKEVKAYIDDPLVHDKVSARWFTEFVGQIDRTNAQAAGLNVPFLLQVGGGDKLVHPDGSRAFFDNVAVDDRTFQWYDGFYHEIYNELERDRPLQDLVDWLRARI